MGFMCRRLEESIRECGETARRRCPLYDISPRGEQAKPYRLTPRGLAKLLEHEQWLAREQGLMRLGRNVEALGFVKEHSGYNDVKSWAGKKLQWVESEGFSREIGYDSKAKVIYEKFLEPQMSAPPEQDSDFVKGLVAILESKEPGE